MPNDMAEDSEDLFNEDGMEEEYLEGDEIDELEEGFMKGYKDNNIATCAMCRRVLKSKDETIEIEINDEPLRFCSERCAEKFKLAQE